MAKVTLNQLLNKVRGHIGGLVFRQRPDGMVIIGQSPKYRKGKGSPKQKAHRERFREAAKYARWAAKEHPIYAELAAGVGASSWKSPYNFALSDWFEAPVIHRIERASDRIRVQASDNILVTRVRVSVLDEAGKVLERGEAIRAQDSIEDDWWEFATQAQGMTVMAEAWDLAKNVTRLGPLRPATQGHLPQIRKVDLE